jgi:phospholipase/lecithinase/hemolysin
MLDRKVGSAAAGWAFAALLACALATPVTAADKAPFDRIVVFGTSLSDAGNAFALRGGTNTPPDYSVDPFLIPDRPYARGGHHFSNGATWIEQFARPLGLAGSVQPAFRSASSGATNYAVGGARAHDDGMNVNLPDQVQRFLQDAGGDAPSSALYVIEIGANDIRDALVAGGDITIIGAALASISDNTMQLYAAGARNFLVWNAPDLGRTPAIIALDRLIPGTALGASMLTQAFNLNLDNVLAQLSMALPGVQFTRLDVHAKLNTIVAEPQTFGLRDVTTACINPSTPPFACKSPDVFLFWDGIHPTRAAHAILAQEAAFALAP